jgi:ankyrin repeat protein
MAPAAEAGKYGFARTSVIDSLCCTAETGDIEKLRECLERVIDPNRSNRLGPTTLHLAV